AFIWTALSSGGSVARDVIADFKMSSGSYDSSEIDRIDISALNSNAAYTFLGNGASFDGTASAVIWSQSGADTLVQVDIDGNSSAEFEILLSGFTATNLQASHFAVPVSLTFTSGTDTLTGTEADGDTFTTSDANFAAADTLSAGLGSDTLIFTNAATITSAELADKTGIDVMQLGGNSTITLSDAFVDTSDSDSVRINNSTYTVSLDSSALNAARTVTIGGTGAVTLSAAGKVSAVAGVNTTMNGSSGADTLTGNSGADTLKGAYGGDTISAGAGNDVIYADGIAFTNSTVSGMKLWLDAGNVNGDNTSVASGAAVGTWTDLSDQGNNATQATADNKPTFAYGSIGRAAIAFNSDNAQFLIADALGTFARSAHTVVFVGDPTLDPGGDETTMLAWNNDSYANSEEWLVDASGQITHKDGDTSVVASDVNYLNAGVFGFIATADGTTAAGYVNGTAKNSFSDGLTTSATKFSIGQEYDSGAVTSDYFNGNIYEIMLFDSVLSASNLDIVNQYIANKYGFSYSGIALGADTLTGGTGADTFTWANGSYSSGDSSARDSIADFNSGSGSFSVSEGDKIDLSTYISTPFSILGLGGANSVVNQIWWAQSTNDTIVSLDTNGDNTADFSIKLTGFTAQNLNAGDFVLGSTSSVTSTGTSGANTIDGDSTKVNIIDGLGGNDTLNGGANG
ncbi:MAG: hypothetical protein ACD_45C00640G0001, partial [uncultured bacterium]